MEHASATPRAGATTAARTTDRSHHYRARRVLMCAPTQFAVVYDINPWMRETLDSALRVDQPHAQHQWSSLVEAYRTLGHAVEFVDPAPGQADMVFTANAGTVIDGKVLTARFRHDQRRGEEPYFLKLFDGWADARRVRDVRVAQHVNEGEGDFALAGDLLLAGHGFRTSREAHDEARDFFDLEVLSLQLVDPRFYHLDTALSVLADDQIAWYPPAFDEASRAALVRRFPDAIEATPADAYLLGLNMMSDGYHVVLSSGADDLAQQLRHRGFEPVAIDLSELRKSGGSVKCCTLEMRM